MNVVLLSKAVCVPPPAYEPTTEFDTRKVYNIISRSSRCYLDGRNKEAQIKVTSCAHGRRSPNENVLK